MTTDAHAQFSPAPDATAAERCFRRTLVVTTILKLALAVAVPFTSDEAYFVVWGRHLDYGYYDHGAMTGWWLWAMSFFGDSGWLMRLPAVLVGQFVGWSLWRMLRPIEPAKAAWAATLYLVSPISILNFLITTDTPLLFFTVVAVAFVFRGVQRGHLLEYFAGGLALGLAFLSKYFAVLLGVSFAVLLLACVGRPRIKELLVLLAGIIPGVGINVAWNYHHGWVNVLFNLITRQEKSGLNLASPALYLGMLLVLAGPGVLLALLRRKNADRVPWSDAWQTMRGDGTVVFAIVFAVPLTAFLVVAFTHNIGVHWVLSFFPFFAAVLFARFGAEGLKRMIRPTAIYACVPAIIGVIALPLLPVEMANRHRSAFTLVLSARPHDVLAELAPYRPRFLLTTQSYAKSALFGFYDHTNVPVVGPGSYHGRQDDLLTDMRAWAGRDIMIVTNNPRDFERCGDWFARSEVKEHTVHGARMYVLLGEQFNYPVYREQVLQVIADRYYRMPGWLQRIAEPSFFLERYGVQPRPVAGGTR